MRILNRAEKAFWLLDQVSSMNFAIAAEGTGMLRTLSIEKAAQALMRRYPMAAVHIVQEGSVLRFEAAEGMPEIRTCSIPWIQDLETDLTRPFPEGGPLWRITLWQGPENFALIVTFHHCIADGRSGFRFLLDLLSVLDTQELPSLPAAGLQNRFEGAMFVPRPPPARPDVLPWFSKKTGPSVPRLTHISLTENESSGIVQSAKKNSLTVHGLVGAAQLCALASLLDSKSANLALSTPADARARLPANDSMLELCITLVTSPVLAEPGRMLECAREISAHIKSEMREDFLRFYETMPDADALLAKEGGIRLFGTMMQRGVQASVLSNVGTVELPVFSSFKVESMCFTVHPTLLQPVFTTLTTCNGRMHLLLNHDSARWEEGTFQKFTEAFRANLGILAGL